MIQVFSRKFLINFIFHLRFKIGFQTWVKHELNPAHLFFSLFLSSLSSFSFSSFFFLSSSFHSLSTHFFSTPVHRRSSPSYHFRRRTTHLAWPHPRRRLFDPRNPQKRRETPRPILRITPFSSLFTVVMPSRHFPQLHRSLEWALWPENQPIYSWKKRSTSRNPPMRWSSSCHRGAATKPPNTCAVSLKLTLSWTQLKNELRYYLRIKSCAIAKLVKNSFFAPVCFVEVRGYHRRALNTSNV